MKLGFNQFKRICVQAKEGQYAERRAANPQLYRDFLERRLREEGLWED